MKIDHKIFQMVNNNSNKKRKFDMKKQLLPLAILFSLAFFALSFAVETKKVADNQVDKPKALKNQTTCPVMGGPIDSSAYTDIQGQRVYHCCPACSKKLKADPDKYFKKAAEDGILFQNIQKNCPITGEPIDSTVYVDYNGRRIFFCCKNCITDFNKAPDSLLLGMDKPAAEQKLKECDHHEQPESHEGHGH
jgi:YHS domain-containing protein